MLKQRLLTAAVLIPLILLAIFTLPSLGFLGLLLLVTVLAAREWFDIIDITPVWLRWLAISLTTLLVLLSLPLGSEREMLLIGLSFWLVISAVIMLYAHRPLPARIQTIILQPVFSWLLATAVLVFFVYSALFIHGVSLHGAQWVLHLLVTVWLMDTGGYFAGKRWGRHALAKQISPNKTFEGLAGGLLLVAVWAGIGIALGLNEQINSGIWLLLTLITALVSVVGDLFESVFKRAHHVKDSGQLLPGHGGILDRIDSLLAAAPVFAAGLWILGF